MHGTEPTAPTATAEVDADRRRLAWRRITVRQLTCLCERAAGSDPAARDAAARAARLARLLELDEVGALAVR
ncbi:MULTISPECIES: hypothetical protein [unclassified Blastococcus]